jgi:hypothetical protein
MRGALTHAVLLVLALVAALATWTREPAAAGDPTVEVWTHPTAELAAVTYLNGTHTVELERRGEGAQAYLWGRETFPTPPDFSAPPDSATASAAPALSTEEYPLETDADTLFARLAQLRAIRDLGPSDDEKLTTYGLSAPEPSLSVRFADGTERKLVFGSSVAGGGPRYMLDVAAAHVYVVSPELVIPFEGGAGSLRLVRYLGFRSDDVTAVTVRVGATERTMQRRVVDSPPRPIWTPTDSETPDVAFGLLMQQLLENLWVLHYDPSVAQVALQSLIRAEFLGQGRELGWIELYKGVGEGGAPKYYMRTQKTIVMGEIEPGQAARIEQDIRTQFRAGAAQQ